jgi:chromosome segregation ATPase
MWEWLTKRKQIEALASDVARLREELTATQARLVDVSSLANSADAAAADAQTRVASTSVRFDRIEEGVEALAHRIEQVAGHGDQIAGWLLERDQPIEENERRWRETDERVTAIAHAIARVELRFRLAEEEQDRRFGALIERIGRDRTDELQ